MLTQDQINFLESLSEQDANRVIHVCPYDPNAEKVSGELIQEISKVLPEADVHFIGSAALKIAGEKDIDLIILLQKDRHEEAVFVLTHIYGSPKSPHKWHFQKGSFEVSPFLFQPDHPKALMWLSNFEKLKSNRDMCAKYETLKMNYEGKMAKEYEAAKMNFINSIQ